MPLGEDLVIHILDIYIYVIYMSYLDIYIFCFYMIHIFGKGGDHIHNIHGPPKRPMFQTRKGLFTVSYADVYTGNVSYYVAEVELTLEVEKV